jgi:hypothetical protein
MLDFGFLVTDFGPKCIGVTLKNLLDCIFPILLEEIVVVASNTISILAILSRRKTLAVQLKTTRVFTVAVPLLVHWTRFKGVEFAGRSHL